MEKILSSLPLQTKYSICTLILFLGYPLLLLFFSQVDVYHQYFFCTGFIVILYNFFRLFYIFTLTWLCYILGDYVLCFFIKNKEHRAINLESLILTFFVGISAWHIFLLILGFAGLYQRSVMAVLTIALFILSLPRLDKLIRYGLEKKSTIYSPGVWLFLAPVFLFLITKGLYPAGGHDYFTHYFPYYREVVESGTILQNRLWYHFYYDKGMGLFFLSMLLTDPLAPQLVTTAMLLVSTGIVFSLIRQASPWRFLPWIAIAFYIAFLIYTPGPIPARHDTGWGDLEKSHEPASILMFSLLWLTIRLPDTRDWKLERVSLILIATALAIMSTAMAAFAGIYLTIAMLCFLFYKNKPAAMSIFWALFAMGTSTATLLLVNYLLTGLPDEQT